MLRFLWFEPLQSLVPACLPAWAPLRSAGPCAQPPAWPEGEVVAPRLAATGKVQEHLPGRAGEMPLQMCPGVPACWDRGGDRGAGRPTPGREGAREGDFLEDSTLARESQ